MAVVRLDIPNFMTGNNLNSKFCLIHTVGVLVNKGETIFKVKWLEVLV